MGYSKKLEKCLRKSLKKTKDYSEQKVKITKEKITNDARNAIITQKLNDEKKQKPKYLEYEYWC